jgi:dUTP pyrophosphatase
MLGFFKVHEDAQILSYAHSHDSGMDVCSVNDTFILHPFERALVKTGLKVVIPVGYEIQVRSKSGLALKQGLMVLNSPGTVDEGYTGEIGVILYNGSDVSCTIAKGQKIAQFVLCAVGKPDKVYELTKEEYEELTDKYTRGTGGFGSTGT